MQNRIVQISDTHLFGDKKSLLNGSDTYLNLEKTIASISNLNPKPSLLVVSGDCSQDWSLESYGYLKGLLDLTEVKYCLLPGNHDVISQMNKVFDLNWVKDRVDYDVNLGDWYLYFIDTTIIPEVNGKFFDDQISALKSKLEKNNKPVLIFMHHHPVKIGSKWIDDMTLDENDCEKFNLLVNSNNNVKGVFFGHVHQAFEKSVSNLLYASAPAIAYQVVPNSKEYKIEKLSPGFRVIDLYDDCFKTNVIWIEN